MAQLSLFLGVLLALVIPIFMARFQISNVPTAVAEIIVGIVMGSSGFNLITSTHDLTFLSNLGVILLIYYKEKIILKESRKQGRRSIR